MEKKKALEILGLTGDPTTREIKLAYAKKVKTHRPDEDPTKFQQIREAYEALRSLNANGRELRLCPSCWR